LGNSKFALQVLEATFEQTMDLKGKSGWSAIREVFPLWESPRKMLFIDSASSCHSFIHPISEKVHFRKLSPPSIFWNSFQSVSDAIELRNSKLTETRGQLPFTLHISQIITAKRFGLKAEGDEVYASAMDND
jgi:hypothetical protein